MCNGRGEPVGCEAVGVGGEKTAEVVAFASGRRGAQGSEKAGGCGEARTAEAAGFARDVAEHAESGAARRDRLFDASLQKVQGRVGTGVAGLRREGLHVGVRDRKVGAAKTVEAQVDRALTGGVRAGEESEPGVERGYQTADDPQPCPRCRGQKHQVVPVSQRGVVVGDREPDGDPAVAQREQTGAARLPHGAAKFDVQEEQVAAAGIRVRVAEVDRRARAAC